ncbi:hypothetical protein [Streptomyces carpaticus]|uniref:Uncharacterized protein n=1 Tax=Streptomyces carpaticus TaxID=285558 RepID=A0ABV4ZUV1_9ACTN
MARRDRYGSAADQVAADRAATAPVVRTEPVRITVDLTPEQHRALRRWCAMTVVETEVPQAPQAEVVRALIDLLVGGDPEAPGLQAPVETAVRRRLESRAEEAALRSTRRRR